MKLYRCTYCGAVFAFDIEHIEREDLDRPGMLQCKVCKSEQAFEKLYLQIE